MSKNKVRLHANQGSDQANHSMASAPYRVDNNGDVLVDEEAVGPLLEKGGFTLADPQEPVGIPDGFVPMLNPHDPDASCSFRGVSYAPDSDGIVMVPCEAHSELLAHGFVSAEDFTAPTPPAAADTTPSEPTPPAAADTPVSQPEPEAAKTDPEPAATPSEPASEPAAEHQAETPAA